MSGELSLAGMGLPVVPEVKIANVARHLFFPLEQRLGNFQPEEGANKREVMLWWADMLGDYTPEALLWFSNHWLRTDEWGKFPRSPGQVVKILREHGHQPAIPALPKPSDAYAAPLAEYRAWKARNMDTHLRGKPWWCRRALGHAVGHVVTEWVKAHQAEYNASAPQPYRDGFAFDMEIAAALAWKHGVIQAIDGNMVRQAYMDAMDQQNAALASPNEIVRSVGSLMRTAWETEERQHAEWLEKHGGTPSE